jgi:type I restriction enzyme S subunit
MSKWSKKKIKDFAFTASGGTPSTERKEYWHNGTIPWINSGELSKHDIIKKPTTYITQEALDNSSAKLFPIGTVVIALTGATTGMSAILEIETSTNQSITGIFPSKEHDSKFLLYTLHHNIDKILLHNVGSAQPHINKEIVDNLEFNYPIVPEQYVISKILSTADAVIEKTQAAIAKYKAIKQGMLQDLFTRGIDLNTNKLRPRFEDAPELYKESKLGMIPREWDVDVMDTYVSFLRSGLSRLLSDEDIGIPVMISGNIQESRFDFSNLKYWYIDDPQGADTNSYKLTIGDILICFINSLDQIGKSAIFEGFKRDVIYTTNLLRMQASKNTNSRFLFYLLNSSITQNELHTIVKPAVNQASFTTKDFLKIPVPLVPETEQNVMAEKLTTIDKTIDAEQTYLQKMESLKKGLMEDLLSGKKQVKVAEEVLTQSEN